MRRNKANKRRRTRDKQNSRIGGNPDRRRSIRLQTIGDIAAVLGHESRNLFGALKTCLQVLRRNPHLTGGDQELLDIIETGARRLGDVMTDFAVFSRTAAPRCNSFQLEALIDETLALLQHRQHPMIALERHFDAGPVEIRADRAQLRQALWHLTWNGAQAAGDGGTLAVQTAITKAGTRIVIHDNGPGIARSQLVKIFEPLYTTKPRSAGLGLAVARRVIEAHGGRLSVRSQPGRGASFIVDLPTPPQAMRRRLKAARQRKR